MRKAALHIHEPLTLKTPPKKRKQNYFSALASRRITHPITMMVMATNTPNPIRDTALFIALLLIRFRSGRSRCSGVGGRIDSETSPRMGKAPHQGSRFCCQTLDTGHSNYHYSSPSRATVHLRRLTFQTQVSPTILRPVG